MHEDHISSEDLHLKLSRAGVKWSRWDERFSRTYSLTPDIYGTRAALPYFKPSGWRRLAVASVPSHVFAEQWPVAYHGTAVGKLDPILDKGLERPKSEADVAHGQAGSRTRASIYLTPSIEYAAFPAYAQFFEIADGHWLQTVLQVRVRPGSFVERHGTLGSKHWPADVRFEQWSPRHGPAGVPDRGRDGRGTCRLMGDSTIFDRSDDAFRYTVPKLIANALNYVSQSFRDPSRVCTSLSFLDVTFTVVADCRTAAGGDGRHGPRVRRRGGPARLRRDGGQGTLREQRRASCAPDHVFTLQ